MNAVSPSVSTFSNDSVSVIDNSTINCFIPKKRGFKLASLNINKLSTHIDEVRILLAEKNFDVLAIQETKLNMSDKDCNFYICDYELVQGIGAVITVEAYAFILNLQ